MPGRDCGRKLRPMDSDSNATVRIRLLRREEMPLTTALANAEGWNVGIGDEGAFFDADPEGSFAAEENGEVIGCLLAGATGGSFGFIGRYLVRRDRRGRGIGMRLWQTGLAHLEAAGASSVGLNAALKMEKRYAAAGFVRSHRNARYSDKSPAPEVPPSGPVPLASIPFEAIARYDEAVFGFPREGFLRSWLAVPQSRGLALADGGKLRGYGLLRPLRTGWKVGPLFADSPEKAALLYEGLRAGLPAGTPVFLEVPLVNAVAVSFAKERGMRLVFENVRMYRGKIPAPVDRREYSGLSTELG